MRKNSTSNDNIQTKLIPGLSSQYRIVSLPYWAWYWLDDYMTKNKISYHGIYKTFGIQQDITETLKSLAELHHEFSMREVYNLANDNDPCDETIKLRLKKKKMPEKSYQLPRIYKLFGFMPCATSLEAVWERRNYYPSNRLK
ncbi:MAG: hypothetical protein AAF549_02555 [Pseudomonadota bacterium]